MYFQVGTKSALEAYSKLFSFVEVNNTFYEYPNQRTVEGWRRIVPAGFVFSVRCHQDLTHRIGFKPTDKAFEVFYRMKAYCDALDAPYLVLETPANAICDRNDVLAAKDFFSSLSLGEVKLVWEYRAPWTPQVANLMRDFGIIQSVDLSVQMPNLESSIVYSRLFGKGKHNIYQFTDDELVEIQARAEGIGAKTAVLAYHGQRMYSDAARFQRHLQTGQFPPVTKAVGAASAEAVLAEDACFPSSKTALVADQGWKVIDLAADRRVHLGDVLVRLPDRIYCSLSEVVSELEAII